MPEKYVVFKIDDLDKIKSLIETPSLLPEPIDDAVVIRKQDIFAGPALHVYAHSISLAARLASDQPTHERLQNIADYFHGEATDADSSAWKLPD